jgi:release factor glutamine methyltransferase
MRPMAARTSDATGRTAGALLADTTAALGAAGSPTPRLDAELLVAHAFGRDRTWLHAHPTAELGMEDISRLEEWTTRRGRGEPIAYIRGFKEWFGLRLITDQRALIPRPETELVVELAISEIAGRLVRDDRAVTAWDVGTGSGAVAVAVALRFRAALALGRIRLVASDVASEALELAAENLGAHGVGKLVTLAASDLLEVAGGAVPRPDVVVANLPYVTTAAVDAGFGSLAYEPRRALDGGLDGLDELRRLIEQLPARLAPGGVALLEVGAGQARAVVDAASGLPVPTASTIEPDLAGIDRIVRIARLDG